MAPGLSPFSVNAESPIKNPSIINYAEYRKEQMSDHFTFYWRILQNSQELEAVMVVKGSSYAAVGWRPLSINATCKGFPVLEDPPSSGNHSTEQLTNLATNQAPTDHGEPVPEPEPVILLGSVVAVIISNAFAFR